MWPPNYAWEALRKSHFEEAAYQQARARIKQGQRPTPRGMAILAEFAIARNHTEKRSPQPDWRIYFPDRGARELLSLAEDLESNVVAVPFRGVVLRELANFGYHRLVLKYWEKALRSGGSRDYGMVRSCPRLCRTEKPPKRT